MSVRHLRRPAMPAIRIIPSTPGLYSLPFRTTGHSPVPSRTVIPSTSATCSLTGRQATAAGTRNSPQSSNDINNCFKYQYLNNFNTISSPIYAYLCAWVLKDRIRPLTYKLTHHESTSFHRILRIPWHGLRGDGPADGRPHRPQRQGAASARQDPGAVIPQGQLLLHLQAVPPSSPSSTAHSPTASAGCGTPLPQPTGRSP